MTHPPANAPLPRTLRIDSREGATRLCAEVEATMEALLQLIEAESELLRSGKTIAAAALEPAKNEFARAYMADLDRLRAAGPELQHYAPEAVERLRGRHEEFVSVLQIDMAALVTARAVFDIPPPARRRETEPPRRRTPRLAANGRS